MHAIGLVLVLVLVAAVVAVVLWAIVREPGRGDLGPSDGDGGGGTGLRPRPGSGGPGGSDDPLWWPEFEREFAAYVARDHDSIT